MAEETGAGTVERTAGLRPPWQPGQSGNPGGSSQLQRFREAVRRELKRRQASGDQDELDQLARELVEAAMRRDRGAKDVLLKLWDREDGPVETRIAGHDGGALQVRVCMELRDAPSETPGASEPGATTGEPGQPSSGA